MVFKRIHISLRSSSNSARYGKLVARSLPRSDASHWNGARTSLLAHLKRVSLNFFQFVVCNPC